MPSFREEQESLRHLRQLRQQQERTPSAVPLNSEERDQRLTATRTQFSGDYAAIMDMLTNTNYSTMLELFQGNDGPPPGSTPDVAISFELFESVQRRFAATKEELDAMRRELMAKTQRGADVQAELMAANERNTQLQAQLQAADAENLRLMKLSDDVTSIHLKHEANVVRYKNQIAAQVAAMNQMEKAVQEAQCRVSDGLVQILQRDTVIQSLKRELELAGAAKSEVAGQAPLRRRQSSAADPSGGPPSGGSQLEDDLMLFDSVLPTKLTKHKSALSRIQDLLEGEKSVSSHKLQIVALQSECEGYQNQVKDVLEMHENYRSYVEKVLSTYELEIMGREDLMMSHKCVDAARDEALLLGSDAKDEARFSRARLILNEDAATGSGQQLSAEGRASDVFSVRELLALAEDCAAEIERSSVPPVTQFVSELYACKDSSVLALTVLCSMTRRLHDVTAAIDKSVSVGEMREAWSGIDSKWLSVISGACASIMRMYFHSTQGIRNKEGKIAIAAKVEAEAAMKLAQEHQDPLMRCYSMKSVEMGSQTRISAASGVDDAGLGAMMIANNGRNNSTAFLDPMPLTPPPQRRKKDKKQEGFSTALGDKSAVDGEDDEDDEDEYRAPCVHVGTQTLPEQPSGRLTPNPMTPVQQPIMSNSAIMSNSTVGQKPAGTPMAPSLQPPSAPSRSGSMRSNDGKDAVATSMASIAHSQSDPALLKLVQDLHNKLFDAARAFVKLLELNVVVTDPLEYHTRVKLKPTHDDLCTVMALDAKLCMALASAVVTSRDKGQALLASHMRQAEKYKMESLLAAKNAAQIWASRRKAGGSKSGAGGSRSPAPPESPPPSISIDPALEEDISNYAERIEAIDATELETSAEEEWRQQPDELSESLCTFLEDSGDHRRLIVVDTMAGYQQFPLPGHSSPDSASGHNSRSSGGAVIRSPLPVHGAPRLPPGIAYGAQYKQAQQPHSSQVVPPGLGSLMSVSRPQSPSTTTDVNNNNNNRSRAQSPAMTGLVVPPTTMNHSNKSKKQGGRSPAVSPIPDALVGSNSFDADVQQQQQQGKRVPDRRNPGVTPSVTPLPFGASGSTMPELAEPSAPIVPTATTDSHHHLQQRKAPMAGQGVTPAAGPALEPSIDRDLSAWDSAHDRPGSEFHMTNDHDNNQRPKDHPRQVAGTKQQLNTSRSGEGAPPAVAPAKLGKKKSTSLPPSTAPAGKPSMSAGGGGGLSSFTLGVSSMKTASPPPTRQQKPGIQSRMQPTSSTTDQQQSNADKLPAEGGAPKTKPHEGGTAEHTAEGGPSQITSGNVTYANVVDHDETALQQNAQEHVAVGSRTGYKSTPATSSSSGLKPGSLAQRGSALDVILSSPAALVLVTKSAPGNQRKGARSSEKSRDGGATSRSPSPSTSRLHRQGAGAASSHPHDSLTHTEMIAMANERAKEEREAAHDNDVTIHYSSRSTSPQPHHEPPPAATMTTTIPTALTEGAHVNPEPHDDQKPPDDSTKTEGGILVGSKKGPSTAGGGQKTSSKTVAGSSARPQPASARAGGTSTSGHVPSAPAGPVPLSSFSLTATRFSAISGPETQEKQVMQKQRSERNMRAIQDLMMSVPNSRPGPASALNMMAVGRHGANDSSGALPSLQDAPLSPEAEGDGEGQGDLQLENPPEYTAGLQKRTLSPIRRGQFEFPQPNRRRSTMTYPAAGGDIALEGRPAKENKR